jgi:MoxR-like ATPase
MLSRLEPKLKPSELVAVQRSLAAIRTAPALLDYVQNLLTASRRSAALSEGLSPRAGLALLQAARAWAMLDGRNHVLPDDVQAVLTAVAGHRLRPAKGVATGHRARAELVAELSKSVAVP